MMHRLSRTTMLAVTLVAAGCSFAREPFDPLTVAEQRADFDLLVSALEEASPILHVYRSRKEVDEHFRQVRESLDRPILVSDFYVKMGPALSFIQDGHLRAYIANDFYDAAAKRPIYMPLQLKFLDGRVYVLENLSPSGVARAGDRVVGINGKDMGDILTEMKAFFGADGDNEQHKYRKMDIEFRLYLSYSFGLPTEYVFRLARGELDSPLEVRMKGMTVAEIRAARETRKEKPAELYSTGWDDRNGIAIFRFDTFGDRQGEKKLRKIMSDLVRQCRKREIGTLVLDIRASTGGFDGNAAVVFSYLTDRPFRSLEGRYLKTRSLSFRKHVLNDDIEDQLKSVPAVRVGDEYRLDMALDRVFQPAASTFDGDAYLLIGNTTFSTAGLFTSIFRNEKRGMILGTSVAGGGRRGDSGGNAYLELPNSRLQVHLPLVRNEYLLDEREADGNLLRPDELVPLTIDDVIGGEDRLMQRLRNRIARSGGLLSRP